MRAPGLRDGVRTKGDLAVEFGRRQATRDLNHRRSLSIKPMTAMGGPERAPPGGEGIEIGLGLAVEDLQRAQGSQPAVFIQRRGRQGNRLAW